LPDANLEDVPENHLTRWELLQWTQQVFWVGGPENIFIGCSNEASGRVKTFGHQELVIVKEDNLPPLVWNIGISEEWLPGNDGITRVVTVKTSSGIYKTVRKALPCSCVNPDFFVILCVICN
jgi:hypothetical protein